MFWGIVLGGCAVAAIIAFLKGQNPLFWGLSSVPGALLLGVIPPAKGGALGEQKRARREVGDKLGLMTSGVMLVIMIIYGIL
ncbi:MAG: hypothetical protein KC635_30460 [Myxococcales bacterium]|nr:hypothetical protein [Myxococcales bacterium]MCB9735907.1 hypothetical protein [Deltaproteobacteria bacterium]